MYVHQRPDDAGTVLKMNLRHMEYEGALRLTGGLSSLGELSSQGVQVRMMIREESKIGGICFSFDGDGEVMKYVECVGV